MAATGDFFKWFSDGDNLKGLGNIVGGLGGLYGNIMQGKYAKNLIDLQKYAYQRGIKREDEADKNLADGFNNSTYGQKPLVRL